MDRSGGSASEVGSVCEDLVEEVGLGGFFRLGIESVSGALLGKRILEELVEILSGIGNPDRTGMSTGGRTRIYKFCLSAGTEQGNNLLHRVSQPEKFIF